MNLSGNIRQRVPVLVGDNSNKGGTATTRFFAVVGVVTNNYGRLRT